MASSFLFAEGFELGSTFAENQTLSKIGWVNSAFVNATSTFTLGASTMGSGRSLSAAIYPNSTTVTNYVTNAFPLNYAGASGAVGYQYSFGFQAKLNPNKTTTIGSQFGIRSTAFTTGYLLLVCTTAVTAAGLTLGIFAGTVQVGSFVVPDLNAHNYTFTAIKTGTNVWNMQVYMDSTLVYSNPALSAALVDASTFGFYSNGGAVASQCNFFSEIDNMYFREGPLLSNPVIGKLTPNADVQAQFTRYGSGVTANYQAVDKITLDEATGILGVVGNADLYSVSDTLPVGKQLVATNTTAGGFSIDPDLITANTKIGATSVVSTPGGNGPFGGAVTTGWDEALAGMNVANLQFGLTKTA